MSSKILLVDDEKDIVDLNDDIDKILGLSSGGDDCTKSLARRLALST